MVIIWTPVDEKSLNGILRGYEICWKAVSSRNNNTKRLKIKPFSKRKRRDAEIYEYIAHNESSFELKNLSLFTNYSVQVAAYTVRLGPFSNPKYFLSGEGGT